jgi:hypothetical protein
MLICPSIRMEGLVKEAVSFFLVLFVFSVVSAQEETDSAEIASISSCSLSVKTTVRQAGGKENFGQIRVDVTLCDRDGVPVSDQEIKLSSTAGSFSCLPPDSVLPPGDSIREPCFFTQSNGKMTMFLINVPFNITGRVTAACSYKKFNLKSSGTFIIKRKTFKKKYR